MDDVHFLGAEVTFLRQEGPVAIEQADLDRVGKVAILVALIGDAQHGGQIADRVGVAM
ncbi:MAG: hypothetical protein O3B24_03580 [Verrucomicrobia bacterium]|nr:hypothetical protein [Verrucomicrobiota bacterium]